MISEDDFPICIYKGGAEDDAAWLQKAKGQEMVTLETLEMKRRERWFLIKTVKNSGEVK